MSEIEARSYPNPYNVTCIIKGAPSKNEVTVEVQCSRDEANNPFAFAVYGYHQCVQELKAKGYKVTADPDNGKGN